MDQPTDNAAPKRPGFARMKIYDWRQFETVEINFHPRLTILTGANATGKSTVLGILARHFNWSRQYSTSPLFEDSRSTEWVTASTRRERRLIEDERGWTSVGELVYGSGADADVSVPKAGASDRASQYDIRIRGQQPIAGAFLSSHRSFGGNYVPVETIPVKFDDPDTLFEKYTNELRTRWQGGWTGRSPQHALKEALISAAVFGGDSTAAVELEPRASSTWSGFQQILRLVMPANLGYRGMRIRVPDVIIESESGDFIIDDASGGLSAIIELAWQIFLRSRTQQEFSVLLDEPENHLHPSLQRELMPNLLQAFPHVQFIVATHSPFVVTATPDSAVYALAYTQERRVASRLLDYANKAGSADETLREVLGVESTVPSWAEREFARIVRNYAVGTLDDNRLRQLRRELASMGLEASFPKAVLDAADGADDGPNT